MNPAGVVDVGVPWEVRLASALVTVGLLLQQLLATERFLLAEGSSDYHEGLLSDVSPHH